MAASEQSWESKPEFGGVAPVGPSPRPRASSDETWETRPEFGGGGFAESGEMGGVEAWGRALAAGATFNFSDEIAARVLSMARGTAYEDELAEYRAREELVPTGVRIAGELLGSALVPGLGAGGLALRGAKTAGQLALRTGLLGAAEGAAGGAGAGETTEERLRLAGYGAPVGAAVGAIAPYLTVGARGIASPFTAKGGERAAIGALRSDLAASGMTPRAARKAMVDIGPGSTLADAADPLRARAASAAAAAPKSMGEIVEDLASRRAGRADNLLAAARPTPSPMSFDDASRKILAEHSNTSERLIDLAVTEGPDRALMLTDDLVARYNTPLGKSIVSNATRTSFPEGLERMSPTDLRSVSNVLFEAAERKRDALLRGERQLAEELDEFIDGVVDEAANQFPDFGREADRFVRINDLGAALQAGRDAVRKAPEVTQNTLRSLGQEQRQLFDIGASEAAVEKVASRIEEGLPVNDIFRDYTEVLSEVLGSDEAAAFLSQAGKESTMAKTERLVSEALSGAVPPRSSQSGVSSDLVDLALGIGTGEPAGLYRRTVRNLVGRSLDAQSATMLDTLFRAAPEAVEDLLAPRPYPISVWAPPATAVGVTSGAIGLLGE